MSSEKNLLTTKPRNYQKYSSRLIGPLTAKLFYFFNFFNFFKFLQSCYVNFSEKDVFAFGKNFAN